MVIHFATCERQRALKYIKQVYPSRTITDTPESAGLLLDLVEKDIVRVQDPMMHGNRIAVIGGDKWNDSKTEAVTKACEQIDEEEMQEIIIEEIQ